LAIASDVLKLWYTSINMKNLPLLQYYDFFSVFASSIFSYNSFR
jgi:hypothetical protein